MPDGSAGMGPAKAPAGPDPLVGEDRLHAVFGTGQVGVLAETYYQFDEPFVLDTSKYESAFVVAGTQLAAAVAATLAWYRTRPGTP
jgi:hypothetical protein